MESTPRAATTRSPSTETAIGIFAGAIAVGALVVDHLIHGDVAAFVVTSAIALTVAAGLFGQVIPRTKASADAVVLAAKRGISSAAASPCSAFRCSSSACRSCSAPPASPLGWSGGVAPATGSPSRPSRSVPRRALQRRRLCGCRETATDEWREQRPVGLPHELLERRVVADRVEVGAARGERAIPIRTLDREPEVLDRPLLRPARLSQHARL